MSALTDEIRWFDRVEFRRLMVLMLPLYIGNLAQMGMGVIDTIVAGRAGAVQLAGVGLGASVSAPIMVSLGALLTIIAPMVARLRGAGQERNIGLLLNNAKLLAFILMLAEVGCLLVASQVFPLITDDAEMAATARAYVLIMILAVPASVMIRVLQGNFEGYGKMRPEMVLSLLALAANIPADYAMVLGWGPIPAMGGAGCAVATVLMLWLLCLGELVWMYLLKRHRPQVLQMFTWRRAEIRLFCRILKLGFPLAVAALCEMSFFCVVTLVIAPLGAIAVAAQQVAINVSAVAFMLPLSLGIATSIRAAYHVGARDKASFDAMLHTVIFFMYTVMAAVIIVLISFRSAIIGIYTDDVAIVAIAQTLVVLCAVYQLSDATQALASGLLRGCHDTTPITWTNICSYWLVGFPLACILIRTDWIVPAMGAAGAWVSFIVSLTLTAVILTSRFIYTRRKIFSKR